MSYGLVICSQCKREVHQDRDADERLYWYHCGTNTHICSGAAATYPNTKEDILGSFCGRDDIEGVFRK